MSKPNLSADPQKRNKTRHRGISYRTRADGSRSYAVYTDGRYVPVQGGEREALALQADLRGRKARGERVVINDKTKFEQLADEWFEAKSLRLRPRTRTDYRAALDLVLLPRFGKWRIAAIDAEAISRLVRDLEGQGLHTIDRNRPLRPLGCSSIENYLKPLQGVLSLAVRKGLITTNPFNHLTKDDRPKRNEKPPAHEWTDEEVTALLEASEQLARNPDSHYDYTPLLRLASRIGLRLGEVLGLRWEDFDKDASTLHIRRQWLRTGEYGPTKTPAGVRRIALPSALRDELITLRLRSTFSQNADPIFASLRGTPLNHRNLTRRGFEPARNLAKLPTEITFHDLRHAAASRLIRGGLDPVTVASVLGHEDATITMKVYAHMYDRHRTDDAVRRALAGDVS